jgi:hypothetical protein
MGRPFSGDEFKPGANNVVIISDLFWRKNFNADPEVLGQKVILDQTACTVVGVLKPSQPFPPAFGGDVYQPLVFKADPKKPFDTRLLIIGRLNPGVTSETARAALAGVKVEGLPVWAVPYFAEQEVMLARPRELARPETYWLMAIAAAFLYGIACLNTINLMLVRLLGRQRELSIRLSLGATRWQIVRLLAVESVGLTFLAIVIVIGAVCWLFPLLFATITRNEAVRYQSYLTGETLGLVGLLSTLACLAAVIIPTLRLLRSDAESSRRFAGGIRRDSAHRYRSDGAILRKVTARKPRL